MVKLSALISFVELQQPVPASEHTSLLAFLRHQSPAGDLILASPAACADVILEFTDVNAG